MPIGDFSSLAGTLSGGMTEQGDSPVGSPLNDNMSSMSGLMGYQQDQANEPPPKIKMETDEKGQPQWSVDLSDAQMKGIMGKMSYLEKALQAMTAETSRLQAEENRARQNPLLHVLTTVAGNLAAGDPRLPPAVSALGRASLQLNPQPEALAQRRMGLEEQIGRTSALGAELGLRAEGLKQSASDRADRLAETTREHKAQDLARTTAEADKTKAQQETSENLRFKTALTHFDTDLKNTKGKEVSKSAFESGLGSYGITDKEKIAAAYESYRSSAAAYREAQVEKVKEDRFRQQNSPSFMKAQEDNENAKALAKHIVDMKGKPGMADSLRQVTGAFGQFKAKVMANIIKLDPTFSESKIERIVKTEDNFSSASSKEGQQLVSFGTFSRHAGDLSDVYKELAKDSTNIPILTKGWQWLLKNEGDPRVARVLTALAPVKKEYESFLLNNKALYQLDRKEVDELQNPAMSPKQFMESLNQMGQTVKARYGELGNQYQNLTGIPLQEAHPLSPDAIANLKKIGISMPSPSVALDLSQYEK